MNLLDIKKHWEGTKNGHRRLSFDVAKAHMDFVLSELDRLKKIESEKRIAERRLESALAKFKADQRSMCFEIEAIVNKYNQVT